LSNSYRKKISLSQCNQNQYSLGKGENMKRLFVFVSVLVVLSLLFTACAPAATEAPAAEEPAAQAPAEPTQAPAATEAPAAEPPAEEAPAEEAPAAAPEIPSEFPRAETIYVGGASWGPPSTWNPFQTGSLANTTGTIGFVYETLFDFNSTTGELTPWLAESGEWADAATYNLTLRSGLTFSDGEVLDSEDVKFSIELCQQYAALWCSPLWTYLTGIEAADATHLTLTFEDPLYQEWDNYLYNLVIVPQHIWSTFTEEQITVGANEKPVGSGAYLYLTHAEDRNVWVRNDNWWGNSVFGAPGPKYIVDITTSSNNVALGTGSQQPLPARCGRIGLQGLCEDLLSQRSVHALRQHRGTVPEHHQETHG